MKVLVLSCNMGEGHNAAGHAIYEKFVQMGVKCEFADTLAIAGMRISRTVNNTYVGITTASPKTFGRIYSIGRAVSDFNTNVLRCKSPVYAANTLYRKKLAAYIKEGGYDVAVMPHLFPAECLTCLRHHEILDTPFVNIATDYACIPFWEETDPDYFVIPHEELAEDFYSRKIPRDKLLPFGIPVSDCFRQKNDITSARAQLNLEGDKPIMLIMSGSMGFGNLEKLTAALYSKFNAGIRIVILCGRNEELRQRLSESFAGNSDVILQPFTDRVSLFMDAADMVFTKPGGLTSTEAAVKNKLLIHTAPIPGCETINARFFGERGMSVSISDPNDCDALAEAAHSLWLDGEAQAKMLEAQRLNINPNAADDICNFIIERFS